MSAHSFEDVHTFLLRDVRLVNGPSRPHCPHTDHLSCSPAVLSRINKEKFRWAAPPIQIPSFQFLMFFIVKESFAAQEFKVFLPAFLKRRHICLDRQSGRLTLLAILVPIFNHWPQFSRTSLGDTEARHFPRWHLVAIRIGLSWWLFRWRRPSANHLGLLPVLPLFDSLLPVFDSSLPILDCPFPFLFPLCAHFLYESFLAIFKAGHSCLDG
mmetsp:Transcript_75325/g.133335  ORF Transcript_75325/g.133335 Transcript_75325/m.133335 type:complete len:212 (+) Transcript_75325:877-1512(+)